MKRAIKAVVQRLAETKRGEQYVEDKGLISAANVLFLNSIVPIGPHNAGIQILQGNQQGQRIGNKIRSVSLTIKGTVIPLPFNASTNAFVYPTQYKMWFFTTSVFRKKSPTLVTTSFSSAAPLHRSPVICPACGPRQHGHLQGARNPHV